VGRAVRWLAGGPNVHSALKMSEVKTSRCFPSLQVRLTRTKSSSSNTTSYDYLVCRTSLFCRCGSALRRWSSGSEGDWRRHARERPTVGRGGRRLRRRARARARARAYRAFWGVRGLRGSRDKERGRGAGDAGEVAGPAGARTRAGAGARAVRHLRAPRSLHLAVKGSLLGQKQAQVGGTVQTDAPWMSRDGGGRGARIQQIPRRRHRSCRAPRSQHLAVRGRGLHSSTSQLNLSRV